MEKKLQRQTKLTKRIIAITCASQGIGNLQKQTKITKRKVAGALQLFQWLSSLSSCSSVLQASLVGASQNHPGQTVGKLQFMKVDDETDGDIQQLHVTEQLRLMNGEHCLNRFQFQQKAIIQ